MLDDFEADSSSSSLPGCFVLENWEMVQNEEEEERDSVFSSFSVM